MALKIRDPNKLLKFITQYGEKVERALVFRLEAYAAELVNHAKLNAGYQDQTSNLKGSIGAVVLKDGKPVSYRGFDSDGKEGNAIGLEFINALLDSVGSGYVILVVAGMQYAAYVEDISNKNVLKKTELKMRKGLPIILGRIKAKLEKTR